jgi:hypothetical protein
LLLVAALLGAPASADEVQQWNETAIKTAGTNGQNPIQLSRTIAMVQGAVHDTLNAIRPRYAPYNDEGSAAAGAVPQAAVAAATRTALVGVIPVFGSPQQRTDTMAQVEETYRVALASLPDGAARQDGLADSRPKGGAQHCAFELARRGPATPFTLLASGQFWLPGPPTLGSSTYASDFSEIRAVGGQVSTQRTAEQTVIARFWYAGPASWYRVTRAVGDARGFAPWDNAHALGVRGWAGAGPPDRPAGGRQLPAAAAQLSPALCTLPRACGPAAFVSFGPERAVAEEPRVIRATPPRSGKSISSTVCLPAPRCSPICPRTPPRFAFAARARTT